MSRIVFQVVTAIAVLFSVSIYAQSGLNDDSFNPDDIGLGYGTGASGPIYVASVQNDGKIIVGGILTEYDNVLSSCIARLNPDGSRDVGFYIGSGASGNNANIKAIAFQQDGKILVGGTFNKFNSVDRQSFTRLNADGSLDNTFATAMTDNSTITTAVLQADGKIIIGGEFYDQDLNVWRIARLNTDGSFDSTFTPNAGPNQKVLSSAVQKDGKIVIVGEFDAYDGVSAHYITRLNIDGSMDTSFKAVIGTDKRILTTVLLGDGRILIAGDFTKYEGEDRGHIAQLNPDGTLDETFGLGLGANNAVNTISVQSDGKILIGGAFTSVNNKSVNYVTRIGADGNADASFNVGSGANGIVYATALQADSRILIGGNFTSYNNTARNYIARLNVNGSLNLPFNLGTGASLTVNTVILQPDAKIIIGGQFTTYNGAVRNRIIRLHDDGRVDPTFYVGTGVDAAVYTSVLQADGKVILGGDFTVYNGIKTNSVVRLSSDGIVDTSFNVGTGARKNVSTAQAKVVLATALQSDGKVLIAGQFLYYNGMDRRFLARINTNGRLDTTFKLGLGPNDYVTTVMQQNDKKIIVGGNFTSFSGAKRNKILRLNEDGSLDATFDPVAGPNATIWSLALQSDGKILVGGDFSTYNNVSSPYLVRLNTDGSADPTFAPLSGPTGSVETIQLQTDGKVLIGGNFYSYNGKDRKAVARINADGSLDESFNPDGTGANNTVYAMAIQPDNKVILAGNFTSYNDAGRNRLARVLLTGDNTEVKDAKMLFQASLFPNPTQGHLSLGFKTGTYQVEVASVSGVVFHTETVDNGNNLELDLTMPAGLYLVSIKDQQGHAGVFKVMKE